MTLSGQMINDLNLNYVLFIFIDPTSVTLTHNIWSKSGANNARCLHLYFIFIFDSLQRCAFSALPQQYIRNLLSAQIPFRYQL